MVKYAVHTKWSWPDSVPSAVSGGETACSSLIISATDHLILILC